MNVLKRTFDGKRKHTSNVFLFLNLDSCHTLLKEFGCVKLFAYICYIKRAGIITKEKFERTCVLLISDVFEVTQSKVLFKLWH